MKKLLRIFYIATLLVLALPAEGQQKVRSAIRKDIVLSKKRSMPRQRLPIARH